MPYLLHPALGLCTHISFPSTPRNVCSTLVQALKHVAHEELDPTLRKVFMWRWAPSI